MKVGKKYLLRPTLPKLWNIEKIQRARNIEYFEATLKKILKKTLVFGDGYSEYRMPPCAVEIFDVINKPINMEFFFKDVEKVLNKFSLGGFKKLTDDNLRTILAYQHWDNGVYDYYYPLHLAAGVEEKNLTRGDIIRRLRGTFGFRDTEENRENYKNFKMEE